MPGSGFGDEKGVNNTLSTTMSTKNVDARALLSTTPKDIGG